jgi:hypothetical protein
VPESSAPTALDDAIEASLGALLRDRDVTEIAALEGGFLEVVRRGKREKLDAIVEGPLFSLVREHGADKALVQWKLKGGQRLVAGPLADGRAALRIEKAPPLDATIERLVEEGVLPPGIGGELVAAVLDGAGVVAVGASRTARQRLVAAVVRALQGRVCWFGVSESMASLVPVALERGSSVSTLDRARAAIAFGADAICALEVSPHDLARLARASLGVPLVASSTSSSMEHFTASLDGLACAAVAGTVAVVGHGPDGRPRLVELHGPTRDTDAASTTSTAAPASATANATPAATTLSRASAPASASASARVASAVMNARPAEVSGLRARPHVDAIVVDGSEPLPPLDALPSSWASNAPDDDPGWELGDPVAPEDATTPSSPMGASPGSSLPKGSSFDAALAAQKSRPSFAPRPPTSHPQTASLKAKGAESPGSSHGSPPPDPFGGLTFEPPPGGPVGDDDALTGDPANDVEGEDE